MTIQALLTAIEADGAARLAELEAASSAPRLRRSWLPREVEAAERRQASLPWRRCSPWPRLQARRLHVARLEALRLHQAAQAERQARLQAAVRERLAVGS